MIEFKIKEERNEFSYHEEVLPVPGCQRRREDTDLDVEESDKKVATTLEKQRLPILEVDA